LDGAAGHGVQRVPQEAGSVSRAQVEPQLWVPGPHVSVHAPPVHAVIALRAVGHTTHVAPQRAMSSSRTQAPAQR
jgi:hypothetical protein